MNRDLIIQVLKHKYFKPTTCSIIGSIFLWEYIFTKYDKKIKPSYLINNCTNSFYNEFKKDGTLIKSITNITLSLYGTVDPLLRILVRPMMITFDVITFPIYFIHYLSIFRPDLMAMMILWTGFTSFILIANNVK